MKALVPDFILNAWMSMWGMLPPLMQYLVETTFWIVVVMISVILTVAFTTYFERKVIGYMQGRIGPNRVGPLGLGQPFADVIKLLIKEVIVPQKSNRFLFIIAPLLTLDTGTGNLGGYSPVRHIRHCRHQCGPSLRVVINVCWRLRRDTCWLGNEFEIRIPGRHAFCRADCRL